MIEYKDDVSGVCIIIYLIQFFCRGNSGNYYGSLEGRYSSICFYFYFSLDLFLVV